MKIGEIIREIREAQKATLESIALAADTNASNLSRIERGTQGYSPETLERIAAALGPSGEEHGGHASLTGHFGTDLVPVPEVT